MHVQSCCFANINLLHFCRSRCRRRRRCLSSLMAKPGTWDQDRWILANFFSAFLWIEKRSSSIKLQNWKRPIVDLTSMVQKENFLLRVGLTWEIPSGLDRPIVPARVANRNKEFASSCPLTDSAKNREFTHHGDGKRQIQVGNFSK